MDYETEPTPWEDVNPILSSQRSNVPATRSAPKQPPASIKRMILELGVRFRPSSPAMLDGHNAQVAALIADVADMPPHLLERAVSDLSRESRFMPKAADLIAKCKGYTTPSKPDANVWERRRNEGNRMAIRDNMASKMHWIVSNGGQGTEIVPGSMPRDLYDAAMTIDPAVLPGRK